ncbi:MAG: lipopolysaccharide transport periplasmic protein LptA [Pseudomonadota bacterium]
MSVAITRRSSFFLSALCSLCLNAAAQVQQDTSLPILLDAANSSLDLANNRSVHTRLRITQGATRIEADRADTELASDFSDTLWRFRGNVSIDVGTASIRAETADLYFKKNRLVSATVTGLPASFRDQDALTGEVTRGQARSVVYDLDTELVRFENDASIANASNEISGKLLIYNVQAQKIEFEGDEDERVQIVIQPPPQENEDALREAVEDTGITEKLPEDMRDELDQNQ